MRAFTIYNSSFSLSLTHRHNKNRPSVRFEDYVEKDGQWMPSLSDEKKVGEERGGRCEYLALCLISALCSFLFNLHAKVGNIFGLFLLCLYVRLWSHTRSFMIII